MHPAPLHRATLTESVGHWRLKSRRNACSPLTGESVMFDGGGAYPGRQPVVGMLALQSNGQFAFVSPALASQVLSPHVALGSVFATVAHFVLQVKLGLSWSAALKGVK